MRKDFKFLTKKHCKVLQLQIWANMQNIRDFPELMVGI